MEAVVLLAVLGLALSPLAQAAGATAAAGSNSTELLAFAEALLPPAPVFTIDAVSPVAPPPPAPNATLDAFCGLLSSEAPGGCASSNSAAAFARWATDADRSPALAGD